MNQELAVGLLIPFIGTSLGSAMVFFMKDKINRNLEKLLLGFASRSNDCSFNLELTYPIIRYGC